ncbi:MAG: hypothetical protein NVS3B3_19520 [Aquirhabdus sp.]
MLFNPGQMLATSAATAYLTKHDASSHDLISRHLGGDWGGICAEDKELNETAIQLVGRILSAYVVATEKFYVITERDRSYTTVMLAVE